MSRKDEIHAPLRQLVRYDRIVRQQDQRRARRHVRQRSLEIRPPPAHIVNPGPDETLCSGDGVMLIGNPDQLRAARELLEKGDGD